MCFGCIKVKSNPENCFKNSYMCPKTCSNPQNKCTGLCAAYLCGCKSTSGCDASWVESRDVSWIMHRLEHRGATGAPLQNIVHTSGRGVAPTEGWPLLLMVAWLLHNLRGSGGPEVPERALVLQMVPFQLRITLRLALHSLSDMPVWHSDPRIKVGEERRGRRGRGSEKQRESEGVVVVVVEWVEGQDSELRLEREGGAKCGGQK